MSNNKQIQQKELRQFGFILSAVLFFFGWRLFAKGIWINSLIFFDLGILSLVFSLFIPLLLKFPHRALSFISKCIGWVNTRLILGLIYYVLFTPIAVLFRIIGKDFLDRLWDAKSRSYWIPRKDVVLKKEAYERQF